AGLHLGWIDRTRSGLRAFAWLRATAGAIGLIMATLLIGSWVMRGPGVAWRPYTDGVITEARRSGNPVIIDFYADWCAPCRELDAVTFHDAEIVKQSGRDFIMVKVDLTRKGDPVHERLLRQYGVKGVPTVVFLDREGKERQDLRLVDFLPASRFLIRMTEAKKGVRR
ncbi:MAG: thioredoxin fold domain-containing protein, partial [Deltaproteobacteria bacterium]|nr:thioredoxin fold domain-containing protein [Deltaproteobacteria bacterium]